MKIYRTLGTILSSFLIVILVIALFSSMLVFSAARAVSKNTISDITKAIVANEDVRAEISTSLSSEIIPFKTNDEIEQAIKNNQKNVLVVSLLLLKKENQNNLCDLIQKICD